MAWTPECSLYTLCFSIDCVGIFPRKMTRWDTWGRETKINLTLLFQIGWIAKTLWLGQTTWQGISNSIVSTITLSFRFRERERRGLKCWSLEIDSLGKCLGLRQSIQIQWLVPRSSSTTEARILCWSFYVNPSLWWFFESNHIPLSWKKRTFLLWYKCVCICNSTILWMSSLVNE